MKYFILYLFYIYISYSFIYTARTNPTPKVWLAKEKKWQVLNGLPHYPAEPHPHPIKTDTWKNSSTEIFIGIASYRDTRCGQTLKNLFDKAEYPDRVHIGVVQQIAPHDKDCIKDYCTKMGYAGYGPGCPRWEQLSTIRVTHLEAKGPTFGRHLQLKLMKDEEFCMQIDSHMDALQNWDTTLLQYWSETENEYAVLSTYVQRFEDMGKNVGGNWQTPHICTMFWTGAKGSLPRNDRATNCQLLSKPKVAHLWGAGLSFSKCHAEKRVPYDPHLPYIFDGEEFTKMIRLWTNGYDVYSPPRNIIYHDYNKPKDYSPQGWKRDAYYMRYSQERIFTLLEQDHADNSRKAKKELEPYGLGNKRTLDQYIEWSGVDTRTRKINKNACGDLPWVPWEEDPEEVKLIIGNNKLIDNNNNNNNNNKKKKLINHINFIPPMEKKIYDDDDFTLSKEENEKNLRAINNINKNKEKKEININDNNNMNIFLYFDNIFNIIFGNSWNEFPLIIKQISLIIFPMMIVLIIWKLILFIKKSTNNNKYDQKIV